ncbi:hypothetical protein OK18_00700 [Chryseobacterium gallinarum]|uniref:SMEK domain-containing protein n=1 Tax=Chryseobacterium gallinarum TaxID=1324352 RepID=A0A0G3LWK7_CHRGL|nr:SMEK domain-containing protein [Chryseobacterium gallinarum]AKK71351.1 hypothetical protein OK18_00700 [Chryseobacterium gallinarum]
MNRSQLINSIAQSLSRFKSEVEILNSASLYDINLHAENVLIPLLNELFGLNLENANKSKKNYPGIDLIDADNRVAFQITSSNDNAKIKNTLKKVVEHNIHNDVDFVYVYVITEKKSSYKKDIFDDILEGKLIFDPAKHIIDYSNIMLMVDSIIQATKIKSISDLLAEQFTDEKIDSRKKLAEKIEEIITEEIYPNLVKINTPDYVYIADLDIDRQDIITRSWQTTYKLKNNASQRKVIMKALVFAEVKFSGDWYFVENKLITFSDLNNGKNPLQKIIDTGTVERLTVDEFISINENYKNSFIGLLKACINQKLYNKHIRWIEKEEYFRFAFTSPTPMPRKITWKLKKQATRAAVDEVWNKDHTRILCFKHIAFQTNIYLFDDIFYLSINPTWSYTWNGYEKSNLEKELLPGIKRLESNKSIYNVFRFISYCLINTMEDEAEYNTIQFELPPALPLTYTK